MSCRKLISDLYLNVSQRPALSILQLHSSYQPISSKTIHCPLPRMLHLKPLGTFSEASCTSKTRLKLKNSCLPKHVRVNLLSHPSTGEANCKMACKVCLWGDFHLVYLHLPSSRWASNFPAAETSACHTIIEVMEKKKRCLGSHRPFKGSHNTEVKACLLYTFSQAASFFLRCNFSKLLLLLHPGKQSRKGNSTGCPRWETSALVTTHQAASPHCCWQGLGEFLRLQNCTNVQPAVSWKYRSNRTENRGSKDWIFLMERGKRNTE